MVRQTVKVLIAVAAVALLLVVVEGRSLASGSRPTAVLYLNQYFGSVDYLARVEVDPRPRPERILRLPGSSSEVLGLAVDGRFVFWTSLVGGGSSGGGQACLFRAWRSGAHASRLFCGLRFPLNVTVHGGWVYWVSETAIGRATLDGKRVERRFVVPSQEAGGGVGDGLATDSRHLYFTRCQDGSIGRVGLNGNGLNERFVKLPGRACPQDIAYADRRLYWTDLGLDEGSIGRVSVNGAGLKERWLSLRAGPFSVAADSKDVFWTWGGGAHGPTFIGRATAGGQILDRRFVTVFGGDSIALAPA